jgi:ribokinase
MIIVPGSVNADLLFKVARLPRPGETVLCPGYVMAPGGKGANQAAAAAKAGAEVRFVGHVGDDAYGPVVRGLLEAAGVDCALLGISRHPTAIAVIGVDEAGENAIIVASGANLDTAAAQLPDALLGPSATILCQNEIRAEETFAALTRARAAGARTVLNMAPAGPVPPEVLRAIDVLVVNELEAETVAGTPGQGPETAARRLARSYGLTCVMTLGGAGCIAVGESEAWRVPVLPIRPVDTTGAGDAFVGAFTAWLDRGASLVDGLRAASVAAACTCEAMGAQTAQPGRAVIEARLPELPPALPLGAA